MSVFVDIRGRLESPEQIDELIAFLVAECQTRNWPYRIHDDMVKEVTIIFLPEPGDEEKRVVVEKVDEKGITHRTTTDDSDSVYRERLHRRGIRIRPHYRSEVLSLIFDTETGEAVGEQVFHPVDTPSLKISCKMVQNWDFAKTVYAGAETHRDVCEVMKRAMERFPGLNITDTVDYLETGDMEYLGSIVSQHEATVGMFSDAFERQPWGQVLERGDKDRRVQPEKERVYRRLGLYMMLNETQQKTLELSMQTILSNLGYATIDGGNAQEVVTALDDFIDRCRETLKPAAEADKAQVELDRDGLGACYGACVIALFGGHWKQPPESYWRSSPFILSGVSAARVTVDPFDEVVRCIHRRENETLAQNEDRIRWGEESYMATYDDAERV